MPLLKGVVGPLIDSKPENKTVRIKGFDTTSKVSKSHATAFTKEGYDFCVRYIPQNPDIVDDDLTYEEAQDILDGGLALMAVQHVEGNAWFVSPQKGQRKGELAGKWATKCGFPHDVNIWLDLEGINEEQKNSYSEIIDYCNIWSDTVVEFGYIPGVYVGSNSWLTSSQLYHSLKFNHFWRAKGNIPEIENRGYQIYQGLTLIDGKTHDGIENDDGNPKLFVHGLNIDDDLAFFDLSGDSPLVIKPVH